MVAMNTSRTRPQQRWTRYAANPCVTQIEKIASSFVATTFIVDQYAICAISKGLIECTVDSNNSSASILHYLKYVIFTGRGYQNNSIYLLTQKNVEVIDFLRLIIV